MEHARTKALRSDWSRVEQAIWEAGWVSVTLPAVCCTHTHVRTLPLWLTVPLQCKCVSECVRVQHLTPFWPHVTRISTALPSWGYATEAASTADWRVYKSMWIFTCVSVRVAFCLLLSSDHTQFPLTGREREREKINNKNNQLSQRPCVHAWCQECRSVGAGYGGEMPVL